MCCCTENTTSVRGYREVVRRCCHSCGNDIAEALSVPCRGEQCHLVFCQKCLTSRYKYSRVKASSLPSINWRCPVCTKRCYCSECVKAGCIPKKRKLLSKKNPYTSRRRQKRRMRFHRTIGPVPVPTPEISLLRRRVDTSETNTKSGSYSANPVQTYLAAMVRPLSFVTIGTRRSEPQGFSFARALATKEAVLAAAPTHQVALRIVPILPTTFPLLTAEAYARLSAADCMRIGLMPFCGARHIISH